MLGGDLEGYTQTELTDIGGLQGFLLDLIQGPFKFNLELNPTDQEETPLAGILGGDGSTAVIDNYLVE